MGFKAVVNEAEEPVYCDYIQEKIDIAKKHNAIYELVDEDNRIQALYDDENLISNDNIKQIDRVKVNQENGKEYLVVSKSVDFYARDEEDKNVAGAYKDRYVTKEGLVEIPVKTANPNSESTPTRIKYTIPFSAEKVDEFNRKNQGITYAFYEGATSSNRLPSTIPTVTNIDYFKNATWDELLLGREKKVLNSMTNRLPEIRNELNKSTTQTKEEVNRKEQDNEVIKDENKVVEQTKTTEERRTETTVKPLNENEFFKPVSKQSTNKKN